MSYEQMREEFEDWACNKWHSDIARNASWEAWQAVTAKYTTRIAELETKYAEAARWNGDYTEALSYERAKRKSAEAERDRLKMEAQIHAQEARTQRATVHEIYQLCTGSTGEPGDWHGAEPVRALVAELDRLRAELSDTLFLYKEATERETRWMNEAASLRITELERLLDSDNSLYTETLRMDDRAKQSEARIAELEQENTKLRSDRLAAQESLQLLTRAEKAEAECGRLRAFIQVSPHGVTCNAFTCRICVSPHYLGRIEGNHAFEQSPCTCWKRDALKEPQL